MGISKLLIFVAVGVLGYMAFRRVQRFLDGRPDAAKVRKTADGRVLNEMDKCDVCGTYVAAGVGRCGRGDCPR